MSLKLAEDGFDRVKNVKVGGCSDVSLIGREREDSDGNLLLGILFLLESGPLQTTFGEQVDTVSERHAASGGTFTTGVDDGFDSSINFWKRDLKGNLDRMKTEFRCLPFLEGLEYERDGTHVRYIELLQNFRSLSVILGGWSTHECESSQVNNCVYDGFAIGSVEKLLDRSRVVKTT